MSRLCLAATALAAASTGSFAQVIDNPAPPANSDFTVLVPTVTAGGDNTLNSITFDALGTPLVINDTLFITSGNVTVNIATTIEDGIGAALLSTPGNFTLSGPGSLVSDANINVDAAGSILTALTMNGQMDVADALTIGATGSLIVNGVLNADDLNMDGTILTISATGVATITDDVFLNEGATTIAGTLGADDLDMSGDTLLISGTANIANVVDLIDGAITISAPGIVNATNLQMDADTLLIAGTVTLTNTGVFLGGDTTVSGTLNSSIIGVLGDTFTITDTGTANATFGTAIIGGVNSVEGTLNTDLFFISGGDTEISGSANATGLTDVSGGQTTVTGTGTLNSQSFRISEGLVEVQANGLANIVTTAALNGGTTIVDGILAAGSGVTVGSEGFLTGRGRIISNLTNNGLVAPGRLGSVGTLSVTGNYTQNGSGILAMDVNANSASDLLVVSGNADLDGTLRVNGGSGLEFGDRVTIIRASGGIDGGFDAITMNIGSDYRGRFIIDGTEGILVIAPGSYVQMAETQNQRNVAGALDSFISATSGDRQTVSMALDSLSADEYPAAFDAISPAIYQSLPQISLEQTNSRNQMLAQRTNAIRLGARGFALTGMELSALKNDRDGKSVMEAKGTKDVISVSAENKWAVWMQGNGIFARAQNISNVPNYRFDSGGFMGGLDYRWNEHFATGLYAGYQGTYARFGNGSRTNINSTLFGTYATYDNGGFYVDAIVGGSYDAYDVRRSVEFGTVDRTAKSSPDGGQVTAFLGTGYDWTIGGFTFGPIVSGQYTYVGVSGVTESGADSLDLQTGQQNVNSIRTNIGGHIAYTWNVSPGFKLIPEIRMTWQHEYLNGSENISSSLDGGAGPSFDYATTRTGQDSVFAGAGITAQMGDRWTASAYWNVDFASKNYDSQMVSASLNFKF